MEYEREEKEERGMRGKSSRIEYRNEEDHVPHAHGRDNRQPMMESCNDFKREASDQAFGACGRAGAMKDQKLIHEQMPYQYSDAGY